MERKSCDFRLRRWQLVDHWRPRIFLNNQEFAFTPVDGATTTMYFAAYRTTSHLAVYAWPESSNASGIGVSDDFHPRFV
jgi:hypothetical protein